MSYLQTPDIFPLSFPDPFNRPVLQSRVFTALVNPRILSLFENEACGESQIRMTDRQTVTKYTIEDLWKFPCNKQSHFFFMTLVYIVFQLNSVPRPKGDRCCLY